MKTYAQETKEIEDEIFALIKKYPDEYAGINTVDQFLAYHDEKRERESTEADEMGWEGE